MTLITFSTALATALVLSACRTPAPREVTCSGPLTAINAPAPTDPSRQQEEGAGSVTQDPSRDR